MKKTIEFKVTAELLAKNVGSGEVLVLATPVMIAKMEQAASELIANEIGVGNVSVGININANHTAPTKLGDTVKVIAKLEKNEGKIYDFFIEAFDSVSKIGDATHKRAVVNYEKFMEKANNR